MSVNPDMLRVAVARQLAVLVNDRRLRERSRIAVALLGVPGGSHASGRLVTCSPELTEFVVDDVDGLALAAPVLVQVRTDAVRWSEVAPGSGLKPEPVCVDASGADVMAMVDTHLYRWQMVCDCGRIRYAKRAGARLITRCRVCQALHRRQYKTQWQQTRRSASTWPATSKNGHAEPAP